MKRTHIALGLLLIASMAFQSCDKFEPAEPLEEELLDGPVEGLNYEEQQRFLDGDETFNDEFFTVEKGLGPVFVATSCGACHAGDGKGHPFVGFFRFGQKDGEFTNKFTHMGGRELQSKAIPGYEPEVLPKGATKSLLIAPAVTGLGFLQFVPDQTIIDLVKKQKEEGIVSGEINWIDKFDYSPRRENNISKTVQELISDENPDIATRFKKGLEDKEVKAEDVKYIGRFGKKAATFDLLDQAADAISEDIGIASIYRPIDIYSGEEIDPEIDTQKLNNLAFYLKTLKAPIPRNQDDPTVKKGRKIFNDIKCASCHVPTLKTGDSPIKALANKEFHPFTDLLVHDMGSALDDNYTEGSARSAEWRTPPLWGLGLSPDSQGGGYFLLHDGRAHSIEEAISFHGGEAEQIKMNYDKLSDKDKKALITFLESL
ncbi:MAG: c-type cytochrome [Flavobacteriaceae bacterium]|nr:c-type cytochrome [Flavobacteriaceae bacterium]